MQKWEHLQAIYEPDKSQWTGVELPSGFAVPQALTHLGDQGWELVTVLADGWKIALFLKRPKAE